MRRATYAKLLSCRRCRISSAAAAAVRRIENASFGNAVSWRWLQAAGSSNATDLPQRPKSDASVVAALKSLSRSALSRNALFIADHPQRFVSQSQSLRCRSRAEPRMQCKMPAKLKLSVYFRCWRQRALSLPLSLLLSLPLSLFLLFCILLAD